MTYGPDEDRLPLTRLGIGDHLDDHRTDYRERQHQEVKATIVATLRGHQRADDPLSKTALIGKVRGKMKASIPAAICRSDSPAAGPREISSRSASDNRNVLRSRAVGLLPPALAMTPDCRSGPWEYVSEGGRA